ncbi:hypothetical protein GWI33_008395 [Rhynchophorus ferrugineus]|uniref:Uncharacterized protein n=1 Tax=Rhynchophorus ferrugineus TaxID=354439 RepID=A0A834IEV8_RHYFE|nr:hypothetical protein GWI33_008395 [Rhynchophorus ferrugineus]
MDTSSEQMFVCFLTNKTRLRDVRGGGGEEVMAMGSNGRASISALSAEQTPMIISWKCGRYRAIRSSVREIFRVGISAREEKNA